MTTPDGRLLVKSSAVASKLLPTLSMVKVSADVPPSAMESGEKAAEKPGASVAEPLTRMS